MGKGSMFREIHSRTAWIVVALLTVVASAIAIIALIFPGGRRYNIWHVRGWARVLMKVAGVKVAVRNFDLIPEEGSCIFVANHQSLLDIPAVVSVLPGRVRFMAKRSLFKIPIFGWCLSLEGFVPVDRADREKARRSLEPAEKVLGTGTRLFIFPEGTRSRTGETGSFKTGAFRLAIATDVPIVPLAIVGAEKVLPAGRKRIRHGTITVVAGDPIDPDGLEISQRHELMAQVREWIVATKKDYESAGGEEAGD
jgi:1-acyl-sn-glycerol-3-phosphate acyltransferase